MNYQELGPTPVDEDSSQMGESGFSTANIAECNRYKVMLRKLFNPQIPEGYNIAFITKAFDYEDGCYREVCVHYDDESADFATYVENNLPMTWEDDSVPPFVA